MVGLYLKLFHQQRDGAVGHDDGSEYHHQAVEELCLSKEIGIVIENGVKLNSIHLCE